MPNNVENLTLVGDAYQAEGSSVANIITGSSTNNRIGGQAANDTISGGAAQLDQAGTGHDWIRGGMERLPLRQQRRREFVYYSVAEAALASDGTGDFIRDFDSF